MTRSRASIAVTSPMSSRHKGVPERPAPYWHRFRANSSASAPSKLRSYFRSRSRRGEQVSLAEQRRLFAARRRSLIAEMAAA